MGEDKTAPDRAERYRLKNLASGLVRVIVWIPAKHRDRLLKYAEKLRKEQ